MARRVNIAVFKCSSPSCLSSVFVFLLSVSVSVTHTRSFYPLSRRTHKEMYSYGPPTHGRAKAGRPARTYIQQLCEDTGCCPEDLPGAMNGRRRSGERRSGISVLPARHDDDDDDIYVNHVLWFLFSS